MSSAVLPPASGASDAISKAMIRLVQERARMEAEEAVRKTAEEHDLTLGLVRRRKGCYNLMDNRTGDTVCVKVTLAEVEEYLQGREENASMQPYTDQPEESDDEE